MNGSLQLRRYLRDRRAGIGRDTAAETHGILPGEAALHDRAEEAGEYSDWDLGEPAPIGHNSKDQDMPINVDAEPLRLFLERVERLNEEIKGLTDDRRDVFNEAKSYGYDVPTMRDMLKLRAMEKNARDEKLALRETYSVQLGLL